jgi:2-polyprenyl-3-methyl-5-hydroxy-6-metoxy-1,4-benzoquinol methylase
MDQSRSLRHRHLQPEVMDQPGLDDGQHHQALSALARINWISASGLILWPSIRALYRERQRAGDSRPMRLLDVATGGGDVPVRLWRRARRRRIPLDVAGCDFSATAIDHARGYAAERGADVQFFQRDALAERLPDGYDVVTCSLFLHHLHEEQALTLLRSMREAAGSLALVNDLARGRAGWWAAVVGSHVLTRSPVVHVDARLSVEGAFTPDEALELARRAGWDGARVRRKFPFRYLLSWRRP